MYYICNLEQLAKQSNTRIGARYRAALRKRNKMQDTGKQNTITTHILSFFKILDLLEFGVFSRSILNC